MLLNGIDLDGLAHQAERIELPPMVKGRTVHIDADFLAYQTTAERDGDEKTYEDMQHNVEVAVDTIRSLAAAEHVHLHLTPATSNKGGRYDIAIQRPYQGNRADKPKPRYLGLMREWLAKRYKGTLHQFCEADDGMSSAQYKAVQEGNSDLSIIASKDKDLCMVPGLHLNWDTGEIVDVSDFGYVEFNPQKKKLVGFGPKFFWAQMLVGDTADNIQGLPTLTPETLNRLKPTVAITKALATLEDPTSTAKQKEKAKATLEERKAGPCGPATSILILDQLQDNQSAFRVIKELYRRCGEYQGFVHHQTGDPVHWGQVFAAEAKLLWMRREAHNENCVLNWMKEVA
jgi:hypothetical protein